MTNYKINKNEKFNSLEIAFESIPTPEEREALKALKFRWHSVKKIWYGFSDENTVSAALEGRSEKTVKAVKDVKNKYGVEVGDVFSMSWGYDQTNVNFFQVVKLVGQASVRVVEVFPEIIDSVAHCSMSEDRTYRISKEPLPRNDRSVFIKDNVNGDLHRVSNSLNNIIIKLENGYHYAYKVDSDTVTEYVSWYA